jgi:hypothetical protein
MARVIIMGIVAVTMAILLVIAIAVSMGIVLTL